MADAAVPKPSLVPTTLRRRQWVYASGNIGKNIVWTTFETILLYYLIAIVKLPPWLAGTTLTVAALMDAGGTLVIGYLVDRLGGITTLRRFSTIGAPLVGVAFAAIFATGAAGPSAAPILVVVACLVCRGGYIVCDIAHNTLLVHVTPTPRDAGFVAGARLIFSAIGAALVGAVATPLFALAPAAHLRAGFFLAALAGGMIYALLVPIATRAAMYFPAAAAATRERPNLRQASAALLGDSAFRRLAMIAALQAGLVPLIGKGLPFMFAASGRSEDIGTALFVLMAAQVATLPLWTAVAARATPRLMLVVGHATTLAAMLAMTLTHGSLPIVALAGAGMASMNLGLWATIAERVRACADRAGFRLETVAMSLVLFVLKVATGAATGSLALALTLGHGAAERAVTLLTIGGPVVGTAGCLLLAVAPTVRCGCSKTWIGRQMSIEHADETVKRA